MEDANRKAMWAKMGSPTRAAITPTVYSAKMKGMPEQVHTIPMYVIEKKNMDAGYHFFDASTMKFFDSKKPKQAYLNPKTDEAFFVTSEQFRGMGMSKDLPRQYTVRKANMKTGTIDTVGEFNKLSQSEAVRMAKKLARE